MKDIILFGNCQDTLKEFASNSARTCVTSPPYYGLRDYGTATWIGGDPIVIIGETVKLNQRIATQDIKIMMKCTE